MSDWAQLQAALDAALERGAAIRVWWRDDDAGRDHPALTRLLELAECHAAGLALAVVPVWLEPGAQARIAASRYATVLQHGFAHANHAPPERKSIELGGRDPEAVLGELEWDRGMLEDVFGCAFLAVIVPPWNRLHPEIMRHLPRLGYTGISTYLARRSAEPWPGLRMVNTHLDVIDWRGQCRNFLDRAGEVHAFPPVALFWGTKDRVIPHAHAHDTLAMMKGARLTSFEGCGHFPHHHCAEEFVRALLDFLDDPHAVPVRCEFGPQVQQPSLRATLLAMRDTLAGALGNVPQTNVA